MSGNDQIRQLSLDNKHSPSRRRPTFETLKDKIAQLTILIELDTNNKSYQEFKDEMNQEIAQLELMFIYFKTGLAQLYRVAEFLLSLYNTYLENRRLARHDYDYARINLMTALTLEQMKL